MSKKIVITKEVLKEVVNNLTPFKSGSNSISFQIGVGMAGDENVKCYASLVNGSMQQKALFVSKKPSDYVDGEPYAAFNVKAESFLAYAVAFLEYDQDVVLEIQDAVATFRVSSGNNAEISIPTVADDALEVPLPAVNKGLKVFQASVDADKIAGLLRKGAFLITKEDATGVSDKAFFSVEEGGKIVAVSTDQHNLARSEAEAEVGLTKTVIAALGLNVITEKIKDETERGAFEQKTEKAFADGTLEALAQEKGIDLSKHVFALSKAAVDALKSVVKGTGKVVMMSDDAHLYVKVGNTISAYTLAQADRYKTIETFFANMAKDAPVASVVVDAESARKALKLLSLKDSLMKNDKPNPYSIRSKKERLVIESGSDLAQLSPLEKDGDMKAIKTAVMGNPLAEIISNLDNGNLVLRFKNSEKLPIEIGNGSVAKNNGTVVFMLPAKPNAKAEAKPEAEENAEPSEVSEPAVEDEA